MKILLIFNEKKFEYDIFNLIRAFYPDAEMEIRYEETDQILSAEADLIWRIAYGREQITVEMTQESAASTEELPAQKAAGPERAEAQTVWRETLQLTAPDDRKETKNQLKRLVYSGLVKQCGHPLPWGDLSGIRPVRLVTGMLEDEHMTQEEAVRAMQTRYCVSPAKAELAVSVASREQTLLQQFDYRSGYSLYVDIPFCPSICLYCTFGSHPLNAWKDSVEPYLSALTRELEMTAQLMQTTRLDTIYIGGGTPTSLSPEQMDTLLTCMEHLFSFSDLREFTVEAGRPDTITEEMLSVLAAHPVTRISINPQTMHQKTLDLIGRRHTVEETVDAFHLARKLGFDHINMDMIVGLPGEGAAEAAASMAAIEQLAPDAFTVHSLALKRAARMNEFRDIWRPVSFANSIEIMDAVAEGAARMEMSPYYLYRQKNMAGNFENVGYAKAGKACLYNILIMEEKQTIVGNGCGAATKLILPDGSKGGRAGNVKSLQEYLARTDEMIERKRILLQKQ
ncbi:MAG: coproporphyrinogen dehydrogenase HemZ [Eubacterium sp.]|nr:coproporphyrinogen dehydrogenase HemZ [Eubacterium sp.]